MSERHASHDTHEAKNTEYEVASRLTHLRLELALAMQTLRASAGLTQREVADRLGVNQPAVAKLERVAKCWSSSSSRAALVAARVGMVVSSLRRRERRLGGEPEGQAGVRSGVAGRGGCWRRWSTAQRLPRVRSRDLAAAAKTRVRCHPARPYEDGVLAR